MFAVPCQNLSRGDSVWSIFSFSGIISYIFSSFLKVWNFSSFCFQMSLFRKKKKLMLPNRFLILLCLLFHIFLIILFQFIYFSERITAAFTILFYVFYCSSGFILFLFYQFIPHFFFFVFLFLSFNFFPIFQF